eukprot:scaffold102072_cov18-Tisochrysis_lutea.AAC.2
MTIGLQFDNLWRPSHLKWKNFICALKGVKLQAALFSNCASMKAHWGMQMHANVLAQSTRRKGQKGSRPLSSPTQQPQAMPPLFFSTADLTANVQKHHRTLVCEDSSTSSSSMADQAAYPKEMDSKIVTWPA